MDVSFIILKLRNITLIASNIDSLMTADHTKLLRGNLDQGTFDKKFLAERQKFKTNLKNKVQRLLPDGSLPDLGKFEIFELNENSAFQQNYFKTHSRCHFRQSSGK